MADVFCVQFTPTERDYLQASRHLLFKGAGLWITLGGLAMLELCLLLALLVAKTIDPSPLVWVITLIPPIFFLVIFVGIPFRISRNVKGNQRMLAELTWELGDEAVIVRNRFQEGKYDWGSFLSLSENKDYFFLRHTATRQLYQFIPKRAFQTDQQQSWFRELVSRQIAAHKDASASSRRSLLPLILLLPLIGLVCVIVLGVVLYLAFRPSSGRLQLPLAADSPTAPSVTSSSYIERAIPDIATRQYQQAIPLLDQAIALDPRNGYAYYLRALSYLHVRQGELIHELALQEIAQARQDIDDAIVYGVDEPSIPRGEPYFIRYEIYEQGHIESSADAIALQPILRENLRMAESLGTNDKYVNQYIVFTYFEEHDCQGGIAELQRIREKYGLSSPPNSSMYNIEGHAYACLGQYDKALESIDKGLTIESFPERLFFRAVVLYYLGRKEEALNTLDGLIAADPHFHNERYDWRALIEYDLGKREQAVADLDMGDRYTWVRGGVGWYVRGRIAYDSGDQTQAIKDFQSAYIGLDYLFDPIRADTANRLRELGQPLPDSTPSGMYQPTPMPAPPALPKPDFPVAANGIQLPPHPTPVNMEHGTGMLVVSGVNAYPVLLFQPPRPVAIRSVKALTIHMQPVSEMQSDKFEVFIWNPNTGDWMMFKQGWGEIQVADPGNYVATNGGVYVAIRTDTNVDILIKQLWITLQYTSTGGSTAVIDILP